MAGPGRRRASRTGYRQIEGCRARRACGSRVLRGRTGLQGGGVKFRVEREVLGEAVAWVARALPARPVIPVLSGLLLQAGEDGLTLSCFDYEVSARSLVPPRWRSRALRWCRAGCWPRSPAACRLPAEFSLTPTWSA